MGREIRRVPADWQHPKAERHHGVDYVPLLDCDVESAWHEWLAKWQAWVVGEMVKVEAEHPGTVNPAEPYRSLCEWEGGPPDPEHYRPKWDEASQTHYQMYETVSEGTPVSPVFASLAELEDYLVQNGDYWDQRRGDGGWSREAAEGFCRTGFAFSMMVKQSAGHAEISEPRDAAMYSQMAGE